MISIVLIQRTQEKIQKGVFNFFRQRKNIIEQ